MLNLCMQSKVNPVIS